MPRANSNDPRDQQLLVRLTAEEKRLLLVVAALEQMTPNAYVHEVLRGSLDRLRDDPLVKRQLDLWEEHAARRLGKVVALEARGASDASGRARGSTVPNSCHNDLS